MRNYRFYPPIKTNHGDLVLAKYEDMENMVELFQLSGKNEFKLYWRNYETKKSHHRYKIPDKAKAFELFDKAIEKIQLEKQQKGDE